MSLAIIWAAIRHGASAITKPPGSWIAVLLLALLAIWWVNDSAYNRGHAACEAARRDRVVTKTVQRIKTIYATKDRSDARTAKSSAANEGNRSIANAVKEEAADQPDAGDVCVDASLADRLRDIK